MANINELLAAARSLRREQERQANILEQRHGQKTAVQVAESKYQRLMSQLKGKGELWGCSDDVITISRDVIIMSRDTSLEILDDNLLIVPLNQAYNKHVQLQTGC